MRGKREFVVEVASRSGLTRLLETLPTRPSLFILNYHRIGDRDATPYDSGTYSCTTAEFDWQVAFFKRRFPILTLGQAQDLIHGRTPMNETSVLLTFDDGYRDNFDEAFPVLQKHGASATFFLPTAFVGTTSLPWWDIIAYLVKNSRASQITLSYPETATFDVSATQRARSIREILKIFKRPAVTDTERFLSELEAACGCSRPGSASERCFLNFDEARAMQAGGMCFGSHTHTHEILSKLPYEMQVTELQTSRGILEHELRGTVDTLAYPVGQRDTFSADTFKALSATGYNTAFSFYSGINVPVGIEPFDVRRIGIDGEGTPILRLRTALFTAFGSSPI